jgi:hypothetical protein
VWSQLTAAQLSLSQNNLAFTDSITVPYRPEPSELTPSRQQYVAAGGWGRGPLALSVTGRLRRIDSLSFLSPSARLSFETPRLAVAGFAEQQDELKLRRLEVSGRLLPLSWLGISGAVSHFAPTQAGPTTTLTYRGAGVRIKRPGSAGHAVTRRYPDRLRHDLTLAGWRCTGRSSTARARSGRTSASTRRPKWDWPATAPGTDPRPALREWMAVALRAALQRAVLREHEYRRGLFQR